VNEINRLQALNCSSATRSHAHMRPSSQSFRNEWRWNVYASVSGNMHRELVGRTFHNVELELNPDFVVYITPYLSRANYWFSRGTVAKSLYMFVNDRGRNSRENRKFVWGKSKHWSRQYTLYVTLDGVIYIDVFLFSHYYVFVLRMAHSWVKKNSLLQISNIFYWMEFFSDGVFFFFSESCCLDLRCSWNIRVIITNFRDCDNVMR